MKMKKVLAALSAAAIAVTIATFENVDMRLGNVISPLSVGAESYGDYLSYTKVDSDHDDIFDCVEISNCDTSATEVDIPSKIDDLPVLNIGNDALKNRFLLVEISIPERVTNIEVEPS